MRAEDSPTDPITIAEARIAEEAAARTGSLDLSGLGLPYLPESLFSLRHLRRLDLGIDEDGEGNRADSQRCRLAAFTQLEKLWVSHSDLTDLDFVADLPALVWLNCSSTQVADLSPLAALAQLNTIDCSSTQVADLSPLAALAQLNTIDCSFTQVADLSPLAALAQLNTIDCSSTRVADLSPLAALAQLQTLHCSSTQVYDL
jgi:internalin A